MKFITAISLLAGITAAAPAPSPVEDSTLDGRTVEKRASITDSCNIGYGSTNGGTTGGKGGTTTTVSTLAQFTAAAALSSAKVIVVSGAISGSAKVRLTDDTTVIGKSGSSLTGIGLTIKDVSNVIVRNMKISKVLADYGDAITIQAASNIWVDHCDLSSDMSHDKDYYDGLCDVTHASEWVTISNTYFHDHWKASLVGHSDSNSAEDTGHLHVTYANNYWKNINSRGPSYRFGTGHIFNSYYESMLDSGINTRMGAQLLIESVTFASSSKAIESADSDTTGYAVVNDVDLGGSTNTAPKGTLSSSSLGYSYSLLGSGNVKASVTASAGQTLSF